MDPRVGRTCAQLKHSPALLPELIGLDKARWVIFPAQEGAVYRQPPRA